MAEFISAVGGSELGIELRLEELYSDINIPIVRYEPETFPALYLRFSEKMPLITLFQSGCYNISGGPEINSLYKTNDKFINVLEQLLDRNVSEEVESFELRNLVYKKDLDTEFELSEMVVLLGLESAEYEPEQFPGLIYRPKNENYIFIIYRTGSIILTGIKTQSEVDKAFSKLYEKIKVAI
ncbi:TATA-box-binding protein C [Haloplanus salinus]|uniref:TATA-box-binding protein C n=1 Tax=Haloplanus salinus TaxID=1126245 RepID=A0A368MZN2_9EURY|nr:TATA-box-binding protein C [Haloplanus salinus]RCU43678.1 TATA-box-binding protein C [Haloplanus salinus]